MEHCQPGQEMETTLLWTVRQVLTASGLICCLYSRVEYGSVRDVAILGVIVGCIRQSRDGREQQYCSLCLGIPVQIPE